MAGKKEADGVIFAAQPLRRQPWLDLRQHDGWRIDRATEHIVLSYGRGLVAALAGRQNGLSAREYPRAVGIEAVERAGRGKAFDDALVDRTRADTSGKIGERGERPVAPDLHDQFDRLRTDPLQRSQRIIDGAVADFEGGGGAIDIGGLDLDPETLSLGAEFGQLVGIVQFERHRRRQELDGIVRLHEGGMVGHQRVGCGVALVEAVVGEFGEQFEDGFRLTFGYAGLDRARHEALALLLHLRSNLLAHRTAQQVGFAE